MTPATLQAMRDHAVAEYPKEAVGFVVLADGQEQYLPGINAHEAPEQFFQTRPEDWANAEEAGEIIALVHSHPDQTAKPSEADRVVCESLASIQPLPWYIVEVLKDGETVQADEVFSFSPSGYLAPLVGRTFHHGILDCYSLVRDYYERELGIALPDFERSPLWWKGEQELYLDGYAQAGFRELAEGEALQPGDVILMQVASKRTNHAVVFLGGQALKTETPDRHIAQDAMLHHLFGRLSDIAVYGGHWQDCTRKRLRHTSKG